MYKICSDFKAVRSSFARGIRRFKLLCVLFALFALVGPFFNAYSHIFLIYAHLSGKPGLYAHIQLYAAVLGLVQINDVAYLQMVDILQIKPTVPSCPVTGSCV